MFKLVECAFYYNQTIVLWKSIVNFEFRYINSLNTFFTEKGAFPTITKQSNIR